MGFDAVYEKSGVRVQKVTDQVFFRYAEWDGKQQCNGGYILLPDGVAAIDAATVVGASEMMAETEELFGKPIKYVILTHGHWDHADGLPALIDGGADTLIAAAGAVALLEKNGVKLPAFTLRVSGKSRFDIGGVSFEAFTFDGAAHSDGDLFISIPANSVMFTGDAVAEPVNLFFKNGDVANWLRVLDSLEAMNFATLCVGHGNIKDNTHFAVLKKYIAALRDGALAQIGKAGGVSGTDIAGGTDLSEDECVKAAAAALADPDNTGAAYALRATGSDIAKSHLSQVYSLLHP